MGDEPDREREEEEFFDAVRRAAAAFYAAAAEHTKLSTEFGNMMDHPDTNRALKLSAIREQNAVQDYNRALKALSDFLTP